MQNYMIHIMETQGFKPEYYDPLAREPATITMDHVAWFYRCQMTSMLRGFLSIKGTWWTRESLQAIGAVKDSILRSLFCDMHRCMHFSDDWDKEEHRELPPWEATYANDKFEPSPDVAHHRRKFEHVEDKFNRRWK